jgi:group I intron endonuclease
MAIIYKVTNLINSKIYVGKSIIDDPDYYGSGLKISNAIQKYGKENFNKEILEECPDTNLNDREIHWISKLNACDDNIGYNISIGGTGGNHYWKTLDQDGYDEQCRKIREGVAGRERPPHTKQTRDKMSKSFNRDPEIIEKRAAGRRREYICIDHNNGIVYTTKNIVDFSINHNLDYLKMRRQARVKRDYCCGGWTCRLLLQYAGIEKEELIRIVEIEIEEYQKMVKQKRGLSLDQQRNKGLL